VPETVVSSPRSTLLSARAVRELSASLCEPDWLAALRLRAWDAYQRLPMPDQRTEGWRRTSLRGLNLDAIDPLSTDVDVTVRGDPGGFVMPLEQALHDPRCAARIHQYFAQVVPVDADKFVALHYAFFNCANVIVVPRGAILDEPIWVEYTARSPVLAHTLVVLEDESEVPAVVEDFRGDAGLASNVIEQVVGANAHLRYVQLQQFGSDVWNFSTQRAHLRQDASFRTLNVARGSRMSRNTVQVVLEGRGSQADLLGVVGIDGHQHVDFQTLQEHSGDATRSDLVIHDALRDRSSANFTGLIRINKSARQTESSQEQKNILLSDSAKADSDPKLEILNNDVIRCTHGAAVGPVDEEMVFYLESRGVNRATAEQLIVEGFFQSTLARLGLPAVEAAVWSAISGAASKV
jgi:Fe-S cluster assembly protein SufD